MRQGSKEVEEREKKRLRQKYELLRVGVEEEKALARRREKERRTEEEAKAALSQEKSKEKKEWKGRLLTEGVALLRVGEKEGGEEAYQKRLKETWPTLERQPWKNKLDFAKKWFLHFRKRKMPKREEKAERMKDDRGAFSLPAGEASCTGRAAATAIPFFPPGGSTEPETCHSHAEGFDPSMRPKKDGEGAEQTWGSMGYVINWLYRVVDDFNEVLRKPKTTGRLFPLPSSPKLLAQLFPQSEPIVKKCMHVLLQSLNSLNGEGSTEDESATDYQVKVISGLLPDCERVSKWSFEAVPTNWDQFFATRSVDYKGDEILTAQSMRWENVSPALPSEVGGVRLEDVVELGCKHYVLNFDDYLLDPEDQQYISPPRVMVPPEAWSDFCRNLLSLGVFEMIHEDDVYRVQDQLLLNGLFGVSKQEFHQSWEVMRIIMNLIPLNGVCREFAGDVGTLPAWAGMSPLQIHPHEELVVSSEDVRCFFYIFKVPASWHKFLAFNRPLPKELCGNKEGNFYPCSAVLPMGFKNSVSLAQHVHRFIVKNSLAGLPKISGEAELRKDRPFPSSQGMYRIYLDNFDFLEKTSSELANTLKGSVSPLVESLRQQYLALGVPRHPKKSVSRQPVAEVQGAVLDGQLGIAHPKTEKVLKYMYLAHLLLRSQYSSQRQMQVVGGGLVYMAMFRRPLLGSLNQIWQFIIQCEGYPPVVKFPIPREVKLEISRFLGLVPLAYMDFRCSISPCVTASDASEFGGGVTASSTLTPVGVVASTLPIRGDVVEPEDIPSVLTVGLFDGIGALRVAADALNWCVVGHITVEKSGEAARVVESHFAGAIHVQDVELVDKAMVHEWAQKFTQVSVILLGGGPPCQGVSGLNASRKGALKDKRSCLFTHVARVRDLLKAAFPWAQVRTLMESVASMDLVDQDVMSESFDEEPWFIDAGGMTPCHRPRLYWLDWELQPTEGASMGHTPVGRRSVELKTAVNVGEFLQPGWKPSGDGKFPTFTTSRPRPEPGFKPAGLKHCTIEEATRWRNDAHRFPPYQYQGKFLVQNRRDEKRLVSITEREVMMGFPKDYTLPCFPKRDQGTQRHLDCRLSLVGNSWSVPVITWLLSQLGAVVGLNPPLSVGEVAKRTAPGSQQSMQTYLLRPSMSSKRKTHHVGQAKRLVEKLLTLVSIKGEDLLLQHASEDLVKYHRRRASIPARLWAWKTVASWAWTGSPEHINALEMRAVLTSLRWRLERHKAVHTKFLHLVDSMVALHSLSRGRSSSRKLRRTVLRINALLLATRSQCVWTYVHTKQNPADAPSRRPQKRKWASCQNAS